MPETGLTAPSTKLEAINWALGKCGLLPISSLEGPIGRDASTGLAALDKEVRAMCRKGMWFSRRDVALTPTVDDYLVLGGNVLKIAPPSATCTLPYNRLDWLEDRPTIRQGKVFSIYRQSYEFPNGLVAEVTEALPFEDCPEELREYVQVVAALAINGSFIRSEDIKKDLTPLLNLAWQSLLEAEIENSNDRLM